MSLVYIIKILGHFWVIQVWSVGSQREALFPSDASIPSSLSLTISKWLLLWLPPSLLEPSEVDFSSGHGGGGSKANTPQQKHIFFFQFSLEKRLGWRIFLFTLNTYFWSEILFKWERVQLRSSAQWGTFQFRPHEMIIFAKLILWSIASIFFLLCVWSHHFLRGISIFSHSPWSRYLKV